jgi:hypothetical protein
VGAALLILLWWWAHWQAIQAESVADLPGVTLAAVLAWMLILVAGLRLWHIVRRPGHLRPIPWRHLLPRRRTATTATPVSTPSRLHGSALAWDGRAWRLLGDRATADDGIPVELRLRLDLQTWLLLEVHSLPDPSAGDIRHAGWLALSRHDHPETWLALRRALYFPRPPLPTP